MKVLPGSARAPRPLDSDVSTQSAPEARERPRSPADGWAAARDSARVCGAAPASATTQARGLARNAAIFGPGLEVPKVKPKAVFREVERALSTLEPHATFADLTKALATLGARHVETAEGWVRFAKGKNEIRLRPFSIGGLPAAELEVIGAGKKKGKAKRGVLLQGAVFRPRQWSALQERYETEIGRFSRAVRAAPGHLPSEFTELKDFLALGMRPAERTKRQTRDEELQAKCDDVVRRLDAMRVAGTAPKGVIVYVAGPDAAGKSSTGGIVLRALGQADYTLSSAVFKAPSAEERQQHWLKRFERGIPEAGHAIFWDRGPAGDSVYGEADDARAKEMGHEMSAFEADLEKQGILLIKIELSASREKQAATFGKRLARQHIAAKLEAALEARGELDTEASAGLAEIQGKLGTADFKAFKSFEDIQERFLRFVDASSSKNPWMVIDATKRHAARLELLDGLEETLANYAKRRATGA